MKEDNHEENFEKRSFIPDNDNGLGGFCRFLNGC